ncbi:tRNA (N6-threonylcarbamoyladenosine(37)-N6)-methyltransferase TrmO [Amycolatopsis sp. FBCC-B4732]|uniref:tRNA (N6-threonylcarbamoyladenosine(37)-N6)-methyltransferase TrmO n=1 Tax=Amycolatopsis sp. FBCC-B4732 TaxID=3079339 RepID=UPI001FF5F58C|nr:tRNA (N6-threonylcarbamoyladenosine(37)-N6)-methyltransferase TrmO [Amycolatopsis sp. FBCC-B4732]UOX88848.1 tRNA (N6-threonylcarbamoyladenosine(37)-N6)-methyltransferase TrmO [Amycolatopsis sp. FBCC-B4732]
MTGYEVRPVAHVESPLTHRSAAPKQGAEGAPPAWVVFAPEFHAAAADLKPGDRLVLLTWLHEADREVQAVRPRGDPARPTTGVFSTRSPDRPNPIGLHPVTVTAAEGGTLTVTGLEAIDGTPILDVKPVLSEVAGR